MLKYNNNKGSALVSVLIVCVIFAILGIAIGWVALSMNNRSINNNIQQQTYFTARSAVDSIFEQLNGEPTEGSFSKYLQDNLIVKDGKIVIANMNFEENMGDCTVTAEYDITNKLVTLIATATKDHMEDTVVLTAKRTPISNPALWPNELYGVPLNDEKSPQKLVDNLGGSSYIYYLKGSNGNDVESSTLTFASDNKKAAVFIYVKQGQTLKINDLKDWSETQPDVFIYVEGGAGVAATLDFSGYNQKPEDEALPFYINGDTGSKVIISQGKTIRVYGYSGVTLPQGGGILEKDEAKKVPQSGYGATGKPAEGEKKGLRVETWEKIKYTTQNE